MKNYFEFCRGQISEIAVLYFQLERAVFMLVLVRNFRNFAEIFKISKPYIFLSFNAREAIQSTYFSKALLVICSKIAFTVDLGTFG